MDRVRERGERDWWLSEGGEQDSVRSGIGEMGVPVVLEVVGTWC